MIQDLGNPVNYFIPVKQEKDKELVKKALSQLEEAVAKLVEEAGLNEDGLAELFTIK